jgi:transcriptional regulator with XRE-family HTH domain
MHFILETVMHEESILVFGKVLKQVREQKKLTQEHLAFATGIHVTHISRLENGRERITLPTLFNLAGALGIHPHELIHKTEQELGFDRE